MSVDQVIAQSIEDILRHFKCLEHKDKFVRFIETGDSSELEELSKGSKEVRSAYEIVDRSVANALRSTALAAIC